MVLSYALLMRRYGLFLSTLNTSLTGGLARGNVWMTLHAPTCPTLTR